LVGGEESHELWGLDDLDLTVLGDIEVSEGSWEVGIEILLLGITGESLMGLEDLGGSGSGDGFVHHEVTVWRSVLVLSLKSIGLDHGSHEDIVTISGEIGWDDSVVTFLIVLDGVPGVVELLGVVGFTVVTGELDVLLIGGLGVHGDHGDTDWGLGDFDGVNLGFGDKTDEGGNCEPASPLSVSSLFLDYFKDF